MANAALSRTMGILAGKNRDLLDMVRTQALAPFGPVLAWHNLVTYAHYTDADTSESLDLNVEFPSNPFPAEVLVVGALLEHIEGFNSAGNATMILGDTADDNGLFESTSVKTVDPRWLQTPGAAQHGQFRYEAAYEPLLQLDTTTTNVADLTAGKVRVVILYVPLGSSWGNA